MLEELVDTALVKFRKHYPDQHVEVDIPESFIIIPMDPILIEQVLINLLENAVCHAAGMTRLTLRAFTLGGRAIFEVADDGCGIPRERLEGLFSGNLVRAPAEVDGGRHGMGIGLSVCATIIRAHGGDIRAESKPRSRHDHSLLAEKWRTPSMSNNKFKILVVEDEANICSFVETLLVTNGYQVLTARTQAMGQSLFLSHTPDPRHPRPRPARRRWAGVYPRRARALGGAGHRAVCPARRNRTRSPRSTSVRTITSPSLSARRS